MKTSTTLMAAALALSSGTVSAAPISRASWIWLPEPTNSRNIHAYFRKDFRLSGKPSQSLVRVTADTRYVLYVNGQRVARGPARSHTRWLAVDSVDIAPYLKAGDNCLAAAVHHWGDITFRSQEGRAGFLLEADIKDGTSSLQVQTDASWKCLPATAWEQDLNKMGLQLAFPEVFDARNEPVGWNAPGFRDDAWKASVVLGPAGMPPWTDLTPADIPPPMEQPLRPARVERVASVRIPPPAAHIDFLPLYERKGWAYAYATTNLFTPEDTEVSVEAGFDDAGKVWVDGTLVLEKRESSNASPAQVSKQVALRKGWHTVLVKAVQMTGPWAMYLGVNGPGANGTVLSYQKDTSKPDTWRVSESFEFDGAKGVAVGLDDAGEPEKSLNADAWREMEAPRGQMRSIASLMRSETESTVGTRVSGAETLVSGSAAAVFTSSNGQDGSVVFDMGREVFGYPRISVKGARGGEVLDMGYGEALEGPDGAYVSPKGTTVGRLNPEHQNVAYADRYICRPGDNTFELLDKRAFRYWKVDVRTADGSPLTVTDATLVLSTYPVENRGSFECSDALLNRIWDVGRWTLQLNMEDAYTDCPWRERAEWWGDVRVEALVNYYAFGDTALMRRALNLAAESQDEEGVVHGVFPTDWDGARLPSFSLIWVYSLWEYYFHTGDSTLFGKLMPAIDRLMEFFQKHMSERHKLLIDVPYWVFIDWAPGMETQRFGASGSLNCFYYRALNAASDIAKYLKDDAKAEKYAKQAAGIRDALNNGLWSPSLKLYMDRIYLDRPDGVITQHTTSLLIGCGIAPKDRWEDAMRAVDTQPKAVKVGSPYFGAYYLDALYAMGRHEEALKYIRTNWGQMLDWGATTFWEKWQPSDSLCHAWSACPTRDLPAQYLGVRPTAPGWKEWEIVPAFCDLQWAKGVIPTPQGSIKASWNRSATGVTVKVTVPPDSTAHVRVPLKGLKVTTWKVDGRTALPAHIRQEQMDGAWSVAISKAGDYVITAS